MNKTFVSLSLLCLSFFISCSEKKVSESATDSDGFTLSGTAKGIADSTWIFLVVNDVTDSTLVINEHFSFSGKVNNPEWSILKTRDYADYTFLWIENVKMSFEGKTGSFKEAIIKGSAVQNDNNILDATKASLRKIEDSLYAAHEQKNLSQQEKLEAYQLMDKIRDEEKKINIHFIREKPGSMVSGLLLDTYKASWGKVKVEELFGSFTEANKNSDYGKSIAKFISLNQDVSIGSKFADFSQKNVAGVPVKLSDYKGKVVLLEFWASWCGPCRKENPELVKTYHSFKDKGFEILAVSLDESRENWLEAIEKDGLSWENVSELNGDNNKASLIYGISGIPDNFLIDKEGIIIGRNLRGEKLKAKLQELFH